MIRSSSAARLVIAACLAGALPAVFGARALAEEPEQRATAGAPGAMSSAAERDESQPPRGTPPQEGSESQPSSGAREPSGQPSPRTNDGLALRGPDIGFPGVGRVLLGFVLCAALAIAAAFLLRRYWPSAAMAKGTAPGGDLRVLGRARVETSLRVHVVETSGTRVLIAEGRSGVTAVVLPPGSATPPAG